jgi:hypothetical protein
LAVSKRKCAKLTSRSAIPIGGANIRPSGPITQVGTPHAVSERRRLRRCSRLSEVRFAFHPHPCWSWAAARRTPNADRDVWWIQSKNQAAHRSLQNAQKPDSCPNSGRISLAARMIAWRHGRCGGFPDLLETGADDASVARGGAGGGGGPEYSEPLSHSARRHAELQGEELRNRTFSRIAAEVRQRRSRRRNEPSGSCGG